jgi:mono/diheme cytochrome c family protein
VVRRHRIIDFLVLAAVLAWLSGCGPVEPPQFRLNTEGRKAESIGPSQREAILGALDRLFGSPDEPRAPEGVNLNVERLHVAAGPVFGNETGQRYGLYRQHCAHCHGVGGDGAGPAALLLNPYPRDFRQGTFKYTRTAAGAKPIQKDLEQTLLLGVTGTAMPSFARFDVDERSSLVEYVKYLSLRGETELFLLQLVVDEDEYLPLDMSVVKEDGVLPLADLWEESANLVVTPPPRPPVATREQWLASVELGKSLYQNDGARCVECHGPEGRGDGEEEEIYDDWNKPKAGISLAQTRELADRFTLPIQRLRPRDFTTGILRSGDRPDSLYWLTHVGIKGTPMPAAGPQPGVLGPLKPDEIWHVVHYIRHLAGQGGP